MAWRQSSNDKVQTQSAKCDDGALEAWLQNYDNGNAARGPAGMVPSLNSAFARPTFTAAISSSRTPTPGKSKTKALPRSKKQPAVSTNLMIPKLSGNIKASYTPISGISPASSHASSPTGEFRAPHRAFQSQIGIPSPIDTPSPIGTPSIGTPTPGKYPYSRNATVSPATSSSRASATVSPPCAQPSPTSYAPEETEGLTAFNIAELQFLLSTPKYSATSHCTKDELNRAFYRLCTELNWDFFNENLSALSVSHQEWEIVSRFYVDFLIGFVLEQDDYIYNKLSQDAANVLALVGPGYHVRGEDLYAELVHNAMVLFAPVRLEGEQWSENDKKIMQLFLQALLGYGDIECFPEVRAGIFKISYPKKDHTKLYSRIEEIQDRVKLYGEF